MILDDLRKDLKNAISRYVASYEYVELIPVERQTDIRRILLFLNKEDPIVIRNRIISYLDYISPSFFSWAKFMDINVFIDTIYTVLDAEKYQERKIFYTLLREKDQKNAQNKINARAEKKSLLEKKIENEMYLLREEIKLLKKENEFLYASMSDLIKKFTLPDLENKNNADCVINVEKGSCQPQEKHNNLTKTLILEKGVDPESISAKI